LTEKVKHMETNQFGAQILWV